MALFSSADDNTAASSSLPTFVLPKTRHLA
jgi:hypothetical protein